MPVDVTTEAQIERDRETVASFAADPSNAPAWYANIESVVWRTQRPMAVGSQFEFVARFLGRRLVYTYDVVEWKPERYLIMRTADGPFPMETTYMWDALEDGGTRMTLRNRGEPSGFAGAVAPVIAAAVGRANRKDLALLKQLLEEQREV